MILTPHQKYEVNVVQASPHTISNDCTETKFSLNEQQAELAPKDDLAAWELRDFYCAV